MMLVLDGIIWTELHVIVRFHGDDVREEITPGERQVLHDEVHRVVCVFDARDWHIAYFVHKCRKNNTSDIHPKLGLEFETALAVEKKVLREACPVLTETDKQAFEVRREETL